MKICLSCQSGGHLDQLLRIRDAYSDRDHFFITDIAERAKGMSETSKTYFIPGYPKDKYGNRALFLITLAFYYLRITVPTLRIFFKERPDVIIANGGEATIILAYIGRLFGSKIIYLESLTRVSSLSGTGKLVYPVANTFIVQWESLTERYKRAQYWGRVL